MDNLKEGGIKILWEQFVNRIKNEWQEKYADYGTDIYTINLPTKFAQAVYADMENYFKKIRCNIKLVSSLTLHRYFMQKGFSPNVKAGTLDLFSMYLKYDRFPDFVKKNKKDIILKKADITTFNVSSEEKEEIFNLIHGAARLEFHLYKSLPETKNMVKLSDYFTPDGSAIQVIKSYINNALIKKRKIQIPGSFFYVEDIEIAYISDGEAKIKTKEKWRLMWYRIYIGNNDVLYEETNEQIYILKKVDKNWKIHHNDYEGKAKKIEY